MFPPDELNIVSSKKDDRHIFDISTCILCAIVYN